MLQMMVKIDGTLYPVIFSSTDDGCVEMERNSITSNHQRKEKVARRKRKKDQQFSFQQHSTFPNHKKRKEGNSENTAKDIEVTWSNKNNFSVSFNFLLYKTSCYSLSI